jgi:electron transfer flavoprotein alpha subunit
LNNILVLIELRDRTVDSLSLQLLNKARQLADSKDLKVIALAAGSDLKEITEFLMDKGADTVLTADHPQLAIYNPELYTRVVCEMISSREHSLVLLGYTFIGMETASAMAARLSMPLISNCTDIEIEDNGSISVVRPVYGGTLQTRLKGALPVMVSIQKGALAGGSRASKPAILESFNPRIDTSTLRTVVRAVLQPPTGEIDITRANIVVGIGRGIGQPANISLARKLAAALDGVIAATRPVIDMGWLPPEYLVGLSGKTVSPRVYIACGISGAAQHLAGMGDSHLIIAINKDTNAPIFNVAHYAVVGDLFQVIPAMIEEFNSSK